jgi:outer membrane protein OmpA-like peptidoglycan-associated protein
MKTAMLTIASVVTSATLAVPAMSQDQGAAASVGVDAGQIDASATAGAQPAGPGTEGSEGYLRRYRPEPGLFELGIFGGVMFPSGRHELYDMGSYQHVAFDPVVPEIGLRLAYFPLALLGAEVEGAAMPAGTEDGESAGLWAVRGHGVLQLPTLSVVPFALVGGGALGAGGDTLGTDVDGALHFGAGVKAALEDFVSVRLDLRDTLTQKDAAEYRAQTHHPELLLGLTFTLDRSKPSPPAPPDSDGDTIVDANDQCPNEAGPAPTGCPVKDADQDGIPDAQDECPAAAGPAPRGCPAPPDTDGDGIADESDKCPAQPGLQPDGCPDPDPDKDGIEGSLDQCPDAPETKNGFEDGDGCPDELPEPLRQFSGVIQGIEFAFGQAAIRRASQPVLDEAAKVLNQYPQLRVQVVGHTDNVGDRERNVTLSQQRADAVKAYLTERGVAADRIETRGAGPDEPIADNDTEAGKQRNRRIEFKLLSP